MQGPVIRRLKRVRGGAAFRSRDAVPWFILGAVLLVLLVFLPSIAPSTSAATEQVAAALGLFFFLAAVGYWLHMGNRALPVAAGVLLFLYFVGGITSLLTLDALLLLPVIASLAMFVLAGFNLLFILEEVIYDIHRLLRFRSRKWALLPVASVSGLLIVLPLLEDLSGFGFPTLKTMLFLAAVILIIHWGVRLGLRGRGIALTREVDLMAAGAVAGGALADAVALLRETTGIAPSIVAYLAVLGTWIYISFTTLQRAQYFIKGRDVVPWVALLLSSSFAVVSHVHSQYRLSGDLAFPDLVNVRVAYMVIGVWIGLAFFVLRGVWRVLLFMRDDDRVKPPVRAVAARLARVTEEVLEAEKKMGDATFRIFVRVEKAIPGSHQTPMRPEFQDPAGAIIPPGVHQSMAWLPVDDQE